VVRHESRNKQERESGRESTRATESEGRRTRERKSEGKGDEERNELDGWEAGMMGVQERGRD
jgi:hypothetical protein